MIVWPFSLISILDSTQSIPLGFFFALSKLHDDDDDDDDVGQVGKEKLLNILLVAFGILDLLYHVSFPCSYHSYRSRSASFLLHVL